MSKNFKEKFERVCAIKDRAIGIVESQINGNIENVDAKELGEVADIAKDFSEIMKNCAEAEYYYSITEAMDNASDEDKKYYMEKYLPETMMYYTPMGNYRRMRDSRGRFMYTEPYIEDRYNMDMYPLYYNNSTNPTTRYMNNNGNDNMGSRTSRSGNMTSNMSRDYREGRSPMVRRTYMEMKEHGEDKSKTTMELEKYMSELSEDLTEMIDEMDTQEKSILKQKLATLASKIN